jgi:hypothetical protein
LTKTLSFEYLWKIEDELWPQLYGGCRFWQHQIKITTTKKLQQEIDFFLCVCVYFRRDQCSQYSQWKKQTVHLCLLEVFPFYIEIRVSFGVDLAEGNHDDDDEEDEVGGNVEDEARIGSGMHGTVMVGIWSTPT